MKKTNREQVAAYFDAMDHPLKKVVEALREVILDADPHIDEQIKWNSPAFYYTGEMKPFDPKEYKRDIVVFNLHRKEFVLLVFPTGAAINDTKGLLEGNFKDSRKTVKFANLNEVESRKADLQDVIRLWIGQVE